MKVKIFFVLSAVLYFNWICPVPAATWNVNPGESIQDAIDGASYGDTVQVAAETYVELITLKNGVALIGDDALTTTIDGDTSGSVVYSEYCDPNTILEGFTITNGYASGSYPYNSGGGMLNNNSSPTVLDCIFSGNSAIYGGGGMGNAFSSPIVTGCTFSGNSADYGGGMGNDNNSSPRVSDCLFNGNTADISGGGMLSNNNSSPRVSDCLFNSNTAGNYGGGIYNWGSDPDVTHCTFSGNTADNNGGGMYNDLSSPIVTNCILWGNLDSEGMDESAQIYTGGPLFQTVDDMETYTPWTMPGNNIFEVWRDGEGNCTPGNGNQTGSTVTENMDITTVLSGAQSMKYDFDNDGMVYSPCALTQTPRPYLYSRIEAQTANLPSGIGSDWTVGNVKTLVLPFYGQAGNATTEPFWVQLRDSAGYGTKVFYGSQPGESLDDLAEESWHYWSIPLADFSVDLADVQRIVIGIGQEDTAIPGGSGTLYIDEITLQHTAITYSCIQGGIDGLFGNINTDPLFVDALGGNLRLQPGSPCIDAGDNTAVPAGVTTDLDGNPRFFDDPATIDTGNGTQPIVDMGAYEFGPALELITPNGGEILPAGSIYAISWQTLLSVSDVVVEYSTEAVPDLFDTKGESDFTLEDSYGSGGSFSISDGLLHITTGISNTASVMTSETVRFDVGQTLSLDVPAITNPVNPGDAVFMMCSTTAGLPDPNEDDTYGFVFRRAWGLARIELYPGDPLGDPPDPDSTKPATLKVARLSQTNFSYSVTIKGKETYLGAFTLPELDGIVNLHIGARAFDTKVTTFEFDNLWVYDSADNGAVWQVVWPPNQGNTGSYDWLVPEALSETCKVRISEGRNLAQSDTSDDFFSIRALVAHWKLDETRGFTAFDSAGANDGSVYGQPLWQPIGGQVGGALQLDGVDDYVDCDDGATLNITDQLTLAAWVKTSDAGNGQDNPFVIKGDHSYGLKHKSNNSIEFFFYDDNNWHIVWSPPVDSSFNDQWHHVAGTYDGNDLTLYIDGTLEATSSYVGSIKTTTDPVNIGRNSEYTDRLYEGLIDDVRIYNYALSADEIRQLLCTRPLMSDLDNNCRTDLADLALFGADWMNCGMAFQNLCWEQ